MAHRLWKDKEDEFLRKHHQDYTVNALAKKFECSESALRHRLEKLGISRRKFAPWDDDFLRKNWMNADEQVIRDALPNMLWQSIRNHAESLGLFRFRLRISPTQRRAIVILREAGFSSAQIADAVKNVSTDEIGRYINKLESK